MPREMQNAMPPDRYHRQTLLPQIGPTGQATLGQARILLVGCGALGTHAAEQLVRAGVGFLRIADRDIVERTNLQRQTLFDERDADRAWPKAAAAAERLAKINSGVTIDPQVIDVHAGNVEALADVDLILDGSDNVATRYLLNDVAVKLNKPWVYGACVGVEGRVMAIRPRVSACLRCVYPQPPRADELPRCDTAGVLAAAASVVASMQATQALRLLVGSPPAPALHLYDVWQPRFTTISLADACRDDCPCCVNRQFEFLGRSPTAAAATLCGRDAVQIRGERPLQLKTIAESWRRVGAVEENRFFVRCRLADPTGISLTAFGDGRVIVGGTHDLGRARAIVARFVGA